MASSGFTRRASTDLDTQPVAIVSVDAVGRKATGISRSRTEIDIFTDYGVGEALVTPAIGEQWQITRIDGQWRLDHRIPFNDASLTTIPPVPGQVSINNGGEGPLELNGSIVKINSGTFMLAGSEFRIGLNGVEKNTGTDTAPIWTPLNPPATAAPVQSVNGQTGNVTVTKADVGLANVDNTPDTAKPVSTAVAAALTSKADLSGGVLASTQIPPLTPSNVTGLPAQLTALTTSTSNNASSFQSFLDQITGQSAGAGTTSDFVTKLEGYFTNGDWQSFLNLITGKTNATTANVATQLSALDYTTGAIDASKLSNLSATPSGIPPSSVQGLLTSLGNLLSISYWQNALDQWTGKSSGTATTADLNNRLSALDYNTGAPDASKLTNVANIPPIASEKITGLNASLNSMLPLSTYQSLVDGLANALGHSGTGHTWADIETYFGIIPPANVGPVAGGANLGADVTAVNSTATTAQNTANTNAARVARKSQNDAILGDWLHTTYPLGNAADTAATRINGNRTWWGAWNDNLALLGEMLGITPPTTPASDVGTAVNNAQSTATAANTAAGNAQTAANNANTAAGTAQTAANNANTAAGSAQTTANTATTRQARKAQNDLIIQDWLHQTYPLGSASDTASTLVNGKRTWWGAWNDNLSLLGQMLGITPPTDPASDVGAAISTAQSAANTAQSTASGAQTTASGAQSAATTAQTNLSSTLTALTGSSSVPTSSTPITSPINAASQLPSGIPATKVAAVLGGSNLGADVSAVNTAAGSAQTAAGSAQTTANTATTRQSRKAQNDLIISDWLHQTYPLGASSDTAATLVGGKRTWWGAWNDNLTLLGQMLGITAPTDPASDVGAAISTAQTAANTAQSTASGAQTAATNVQANLNTTNTNLFGSTTPAATITTGAVPTGIPATKIAAVLGGSNLGADVSAVNTSAAGANTAAGTAQTAANTAQTAANTNATRVARKAQNDLIISDWLHQTYPLGSSSDTAATLVGGKRTWWGAWNDNLALLGTLLGISAPTDPASDVGAAISTAQTAANTAQSAAGTAQSAANTANTNLSTLAGSGAAGTVAPTQINAQVPSTKLAPVLGGANLGADLTGIHTTQASSQSSFATMLNSWQATLNSGSISPATKFTQLESAWDTYVANNPAVTSGQYATLTQMVQKMLGFDPTTGELGSSSVTGLGDNFTQLGAALTGDATANSGSWAWLGQLINNYYAMTGQAHNTSISNSNVLAIQNNASSIGGLDDTTEASVQLASVNLTNTSGTYIYGGVNNLALVRCQKTSSKGAIAMLLAVNSGPVTSLVFHVYRLNKTTGGLDFLQTTSNLSGQLNGTTPTWVRALLPGGSGQIAVNPGDVIGIMAQAGAPYSVRVYGQVSNVPNHPTAVQKNVSLFITSFVAGANVPAANIQWVGTPIAPYAALEVTNLPADYHPAVSTAYTTPGATVSQVLDSWVNYVDLVGVGGGGGGQGETGGTVGRGGSPGSWGGKTLQVGVDIPKGGTISVTIPVAATTSGTTDPGSGGAYFGDGKYGGDVVFSWVDTGGTTRTLTCSGGQGGGVANGNNVTTYGQGAGNFTWPTSGPSSSMYVGGSAQLTTADGNPPGGSGPGGQAFQYGFNGGRGQGWVVERYS